MFNNTNYQGKGIQTITSLMSIRMAIDKNKETHFGKDVEKREPLGTVGGNTNWYSHYICSHEEGRWAETELTPLTFKTIVKDL